MPYRNPDPSDPSVLVGVGLPADPDSLRLMAEVFAEEFARLGHGRAEILRLFERPFYSGAYRAWRRLGSETIEQIVDQSLEFWGRMRFVDRPAAEAEPPQPGRCGDGPQRLDPDPAGRRT